MYVTKTLTFFYIVNGKEKYKNNDLKSQNGVLKCKNVSVDMFTLILWPNQPVSRYLRSIQIFGYT